MTVTFAVSFEQNRLLLLGGSDCRYLSLYSLFVHGKPYEQSPCPKEGQYIGMLIDKGMVFFTAFSRGEKPCHYVPELRKACNRLCVRLNGTQRIIQVVFVGPKYSGTHAVYKNHLFFCG